LASFLLNDRLEGGFSFMRSVIRSLIRPLIRGTIVGLLGTAGLLTSAAAASAQVVQSLNLSIGAFMPRGEESRVKNDVWLQDVSVYRMEVRDFTSADLSGEWNLAFNKHLEVGLGGAFSQRTVPTFYRDYTNADGSEIRSNFKLRQVPLTGVVRFLPIGDATSFQPYIGAGVAVIKWDYSEVGDFIDFNDNMNVYHAQYTANGVSTGPVILAGFRAPINGDIFAVTFEGRWQRAQGDLNTNDFLGSKIDLGATSLRAGVLIRF